MKTADFKRNSFRMLNQKMVKSGLKDMASDRTTANLTYEVIAVRAAVGHLMRDLQDYIVPGVQLRDAHRAMAKQNLGELLQHAAVVAKILKAKIPASQKKVKPKHTPTHLLIEIDRVANEMLDTLFAALSSTKLVPMTEEAKAKAKLAYMARVDKAKAKFDADTSPDKGEFNPPKESSYLVAETQDLNKSLLTSQVGNLLALVYEFAYTSAVTDPAVDGSGVVATIMAAHIKKVATMYPPTFFDAPPKKAAPVAKKVADPAEVASA